MSDTVQFPFYAKFTLILLLLICSGFIIFMGSEILTPILMAFLIAVLVLPIHSFLISKLRLPNFVASFLAIFVFVLAVSAILFFLSYQIKDIANDFDMIKQNAIKFFQEMQTYINKQFNVSVGEQKKYLDKVTSESVQNGSQTLGSALGTLSNSFFDSFMILIYAFLLLLYKAHFIVFLVKLFDKKDHFKLRDILTQIKVSINNYILGLLFEMVAVAILTGIGLYFIGVKYFVLLGLITGILNMIPYIGILIAGGLSIIASLTGTPDLSMIIGIIVVNVVVQIIDNNILVPLFVNSKVEINAIFSIVGIIIGGGVAGISGMFLAIPLLAVLKIIFDRIDHLEPWGYLLGDDMPKTFKWRIRTPKVEK